MTNGVIAPSFRRHDSFYFLFVLLSPVSLYLAAAFALPEIEPGEQYDLRDQP